MRRRIHVAALVLLVGACSPGSEDASTTTATTTTTQATTTTTVDPAEVARTTCDALKIAAFDLDDGITSAFEGIDEEQAAQLAEAEVGRLIVTELVSFYDAIGAIAADAPDEVADDLMTVAAAADPWRVALEANSAEALEAMDPSTLQTEEATTAAAAVAAWSDTACDTTITVDAEELLFTTVFAAMFGALGSAFDQLGQDLLDLPDQTDATAPDLTFALAYGDDAALDGLYDRCGTGDGAACEDLYFAGYGEYELWGQTCGASIPLRHAFVVDCAGKVALGPAQYGDDFVLDSLWDDCSGGDQGACDALFAASPFGSAYEDFGGTCGNTRTGDLTRPCEFVATGEPFGYGEDATFDGLWDLCSVGDGRACDDLFFDTPIGSAYEAFGRLCGDLVEVGKTCQNVAAWLGGPVG